MTTEQYDAAVQILKALRPLHPNITDLVPVWGDTNNHFGDTFENLAAECYEHHTGITDADPDKLYIYINSL